ncbi:MAG TPA: thioesterase family protein [Mycobacteriales bacterium]|nr:thioesterase family protein [Mycobacteriales bacterium]
MSDAFFLPLGDGRFAATEHTSGPWDPRLQHAGPPSALLARAIEQEPGPWPAVVTRVTVDLLGPVPVAELSLRSEVLRSGRSVELVRAELASDGRVAARATGWRIRRVALDLPPLPPEHDDAAGPVPPFPAAETPLPPAFGGGYLAAMEWRQAGGSWAGPGPATVWGRMRLPLVPDEEPTGLQRVMAIADSGNGVSHVLPLGEWFFINPDLTVHVAAEPRGQWICLDAATRVDPHGFGLATSRLFDRDQLVARGAQTLYVGPR